MVPNLCEYKKRMGPKEIKEKKKKMILETYHILKTIVVLKNGGLFLIINISGS